jgi:hypothetical protein
LRQSAAFDNIHLPYVDGFKRMHFIHTFNPYQRIYRQQNEEYKEDFINHQPTFHISADIPNHINVAGDSDNLWNPRKYKLIVAVCARVSLSQDEHV